MKFKVWGTTTVKYEIEAESEDGAIEKADEMLSDYPPNFDWEVTEIEEEKEE